MAFNISTLAPASSYMFNSHVSLHDSFIRTSVVNSNAEVHQQLSISSRSESSYTGALIVGPCPRLYLCPVCSPEQYVLPFVLGWFSLGLAALERSTPLHQLVLDELSFT
jgi:hypothetical protein